PRLLLVVGRLPAGSEFPRQAGGRGRRDEAIEKVPNMRRTLYSYRIVNVFAETPFSGKAVAVFADASGLDTLSMAAVARELHFPQDRKSTRLNSSHVKTSY